MVEHRAFLTVDLEDVHEHQAFPHGVLLDSCEWKVAHQTDRLLQLLERLGARATFFTTGPVTERFPRLVREIGGLGHELALHGPRHVMAYRLPRAEFQTEIARGRAALQDASGQSVIGYRAPSWSIRAQNRVFLDDLAAAGFRYDSSIFPVSNPWYGVTAAPRAPYVLRSGLVEIPPSTAGLGPLVIPFSGGTYLRALPKVLLRSLAKRAIERDGLVLYMHPWELERHPERLPYPAIDRLVRSWGLRSAAGKIEALLGLARYRPLCESPWVSASAMLPEQDPFARAG